MQVSDQELRALVRDAISRHTSAAPSEVEGLAQGRPRVPGNRVADELAEILIRDLH